LIHVFSQKNSRLVNSAHLLNDADIPAAWLRELKRRLYGDRV